MGWEDALQRDAKIYGRVRLHVFVWLAATVLQRLGIERHGVCRSVIRLGSALGHEGVAWSCGVGAPYRPRGCMDVAWQLSGRQRMRRLTTVLPELVAVAGVNRRAPLQIRQRERRLSVAAECGSEQREQGLILTDR